MHCTYIPSEKPFLRTLAGWILHQYGADPAKLTEILILLPNRRSCRSLREAFLECTGGKAMLLPRLMPMGELDEDITILTPGFATANIPPAMPSLRRELLLTRLVSQFRPAEEGRAATPGYAMEQSLRLARQLAQLLDDVAREELSLSQLPALVTDAELSRHWQKTLQFLTIISQSWPACSKPPPTHGQPTPPPAPSSPPVPPAPSPPPPSCSPPSPACLRGLSCFPASIPKCPKPSGTCWVKPTPNTPCTNS
jgi:inactivated superfamily I helicase